MRIAIHIISFNFAMDFIKYIYALYNPPIANISENYANTEYYKGIGRIAFNATGGLYSIEKFSSPV